MTLSEVAEHVRIRSVYLAAIEEENWKAIGAPVYVRGFLRTYARYLDLDPEEAVGAYNQTGAPAADAPPPSVAPQRTTPEYRPAGSGLAPLIWVAGLVAVALIGFVVYLYVTPVGAPRRIAANSRPSAPSLSGGASTPIPAAAMPSASSSPAGTPGREKTLVLRLTAASWLRVTVDGTVSVEGTFPPGTTKTFHGNVAVVRVGNAGGVELTVDGKTLGKLGGPGDVIEKSFTL